MTFLELRAYTSRLPCLCGGGKRRWQTRGLVTFNYGESHQQEIWQHLPHAQQNLWCDLRKCFFDDIPAGKCFWEALFWLPVAWMTQKNTFLCWVQGKNLYGRECDQTFLAYESVCVYVCVMYVCVCECVCVCLFFWFFSFFSFWLFDFFFQNSRFILEIMAWLLTFCVPWQRHCWLLKRDIRDDRMKLGVVCSCLFKTCRWSH